MSDACCPCGARLDRSSAVRSLRSPCFRMFMSIRTIKHLTSETKACNTCHLLYYKWKRENPEFSSSFTYLENGESDVEESDTNSVNTSLNLRF